MKFHIPLEKQQSKQDLLSNPIPALRWWISQSASVKLGPLALQSLCHSAAPPAMVLELLSLLCMFCWWYWICSCPAVDRIGPLGYNCIHSVLGVHPIELRCNMPNTHNVGDGWWDIFTVCKHNLHRGYFVWQLQWRLKILVLSSWPVWK